MATAKITLSASRDILFNKLVLSQSNVRQVKAGVSIEELAEDIARRSLLQSLNARPVLDGDGKETGMFEVPAGGRRFRALELLVKQKRMIKTQPVPCVVRTEGLAEDSCDCRSADVSCSRRRSTGESMPVNGATGNLGRRFGALALEGGRSRGVHPCLGGRDRCGAGVHRQQLPHRYRSAAADLEAPSERVDAGLPAPNRRRRTRHRPAGLAGLGYAGDRERRAELRPGRAFATVLDGRTILQLQDGLELRRASVMREFRIELIGFTDGMVERLKAIGLMSEIIAWKLRPFVPTGASGPTILAKLMERHPLIRVAKEAAA